MQGCHIFECCHTATTTVCHHRPTNSVVYTYESTCMVCKLQHAIFIRPHEAVLASQQLFCSYVALQLIASDTRPFQSSLLFGLSFSRNLRDNQLTRLPEGLLNATTQLQELQVCHHRPTDSVVYNMEVIILHEINYILIHKLNCISFIVVFYLALQQVTCDTTSFQSRLHEHVQFIASSPVCNTWK